MERIEDYILRPFSERQKHLLLSTPCEERGGVSKDFRGLLARELDTSMPCGGAGRRIHLCHACNNHKCSNPLHLYWGTPLENHQDQVAHGTWILPSDRLKKKLGSPEAIKAFYARLGSLGGKARKKTTIEAGLAKKIMAADKTERGWVVRLAKELGVSHTTIRRMVVKLGI